MLAQREVSPRTKCLQRRQWGETCKYSDESSFGIRSEVKRDARRELLSWYLHCSDLSTFPFSFLFSGPLFNTGPLWKWHFHCFNHTGQRQSPCGIYQQNIVLWCLLRGQLLQQHLVQMGKHLRQLSMLLFLLILFSLCFLRIISIKIHLFWYWQRWPHCKDNWLSNRKMFKGVEWSSKNTLGGNMQFCFILFPFLSLTIDLLIHGIEILSIKISIWKLKL